MVKKFITVIQVLLILIFLGCGGYIGKYFYDAHRAQEQFEEIGEIVEENAPEPDEEGNYVEQYAENGMLLQYYELYEKNNDMCGWLKIPDTVIDYPVVQAADNDYYLHRDFYRNNQFSGTPFIDCDCTADSSNLIIYAHNMKNGTMFAAIAKYESVDFFKAHSQIIYDTLYERGTYDIISVFRTTVGSENEFRYHYYADIETEREFDEYVSKAKALSIHPTDATAVYGDPLITLSTCAYHTSNERLVIVARKSGESL